MNAVIYARYSPGSRQTEQSIEGQLAICRDYAQRNDISIVDEYIDRSLTGRSDDRPDFLRMIAESKNKDYDFVIVYKLDRFARNRYDSAFYKYKLKQAGKKVLSATEAIGDNPESIMLEAVLEASAEYFSVQLAQNVKRGMRESAKKGTSTGSHLPLGYICVDKRPVIDPDKAQLVEYIYTEYAGGAGKQQIIDVLHAQGHTNQRGQKFTMGAIGSILKNEKYIGTWRYMDIENKNVAPALIPLALFRAVQNRLKANQRRPNVSRPGDKVHYLLTGKLFCGCCGAAMTAENGRSRDGRAHHYYSCVNRKKNHTCDKANEKKDFLEWYVAEQTVLHTLTPSNRQYISAGVAKQHRDEFGASRVIEMEKRLQHIEREIRKCVDLLLRTPESAHAHINDKLRDLDVQKTDLEIDLTKMRAASQTVLSESDVALWLQTFDGGDLMDPAYRERLIDAFVNAVYLYDDKIIVYFNVNGSKQVSYIGMLEDTTEPGKTPIQSENSNTGEVFEFDSRWCTREDSNL